MPQSFIIVKMGKINTRIMEYFQERWEVKAKSLLAEAMSRGYSREDLLDFLEQIMEKMENYRTLYSAFTAFDNNSFIFLTSSVYNYPSNPVRRKNGIRFRDVQTLLRR